MLQLKNAWPKAEDFDLEAFMEEWAYKLIDKICQRSGEDADIYNPAFPDLDGDYIFSLSQVKPFKKKANLEELKLNIRTSDMCVEIAELRVNKKSNGLGKLIALDTIISLQKLGFRKFELDADDMGFDFWPQLGFAPSATPALEKNYRARFEMLKPYLPAFRVARINLELKNFNSFSPLQFSRMSDGEIISNLCQQQGFREAFAIHGTQEEIEALSPQRQVLHNLIENMMDDSRFKLGTLLNCLIVPGKLKMRLNLDDEEGRGVFNNCYRNFHKLPTADSQMALNKT